MSNIKFVPSHFWDKKTMDVQSVATEEQWQKVKDVCEYLNNKYLSEQGCSLHKDQQQLLKLGLFNDFVDIQIQSSDTCGCYNVVERLINIRNIELIRLNPNHFKDVQEPTSI